MQVPKPPRNPRKHRSRARLIPRKKMVELDYQISLGVPAAVAVRNLQIGILVNTTFKLLTNYRDSLKLIDMATDESIAMSEIMQKSLFPGWLDTNPDTPKNVVYYGFFPYGYWEITD
jgi:hypothetical protein